eukprot:6354424-Prorocentrum_lima.AAC.1
MASSTMRSPIVCACSKKDLAAGLPRRDSSYSGSSAVAEWKPSGSSFACRWLLRRGCGLEELFIG